YTSVICCSSRLVVLVFRTSTNILYKIDTKPPLVEIVHIYRISFPTTLYKCVYINHYFNYHIIFRNSSIISFFHFFR
ncbi:hypothetical protein KSS87_006944, partial [Heliosperma pusillum]